MALGKQGWNAGGIRHKEKAYGKRRSSRMLKRRLWKRLRERGRLEEHATENTDGSTE